MTQPPPTPKAIVTDALSFAWTPGAGAYKHYPQYLNIKPIGDGLRVTVRGPEGTDGEHPQMGVTVSIDLPHEVVSELYTAMHAASPSSEIMREAQYLVFSWEHNAFWRPDRCGYTRFIEKAGRYSREEAEAICRDADYRTYAEQKRADPETPPSEICFPAPEALSSICKGEREGG